MATEEEEEKAFEGRFNKLFHKAMGERDDRLTKKLTGDESPIMKRIADGLAPLAEFMKKQTEEKPPADPAKQTPEVEARFNSLEKQLKSQIDATAKAQAEAKSERERSLRNEERSQLTSALSAHVKAPLIDMVVENLHKNLTRDPESNAILWKNGDETLPFKDGVEAWTKTDYAKEVAPPRDAKGGGNRGPGDPTRRGNEPFTVADLGAVIGGANR